MRVLMIHRPGDAPGGDIVAMSRYSDQLEGLGVTVHRVPADNIPEMSAYDYVHMWAACSPDWGLPAARKVKDYGARLIITPFWWSRRERSERAGLAMPPTYEDDVRRLLELCDVQFTCTMAEAKQVWRLVPSLPVHVVGMGADRSEVQPKPAGNYVVSLGRVEAHKNQHNVANACLALGYPLVIVGQINANSRAAFEGFGIKCVGNVSHGEAMEWLAGARIHALPAWFENPGIVHAEAALLGVPSVMGNRGCEPEFFGEGGYYCDPGSVNDITRAVKQAWEDNKRGQWAHIPSWLDMAQAGLDWMEANR